MRSGVNLIQFNETFIAVKCMCWTQYTIQNPANIIYKAFIYENKYIFKIAAFEANNLCSKSIFGVFANLPFPKLQSNSIESLQHRNRILSTTFL